MTDMDEIRDLLNSAMIAAWDQGDENEGRAEWNAAASAARAAILQRVEALREERDAALAAQKRSLDEWASLLARAEAAETALAAMRAAPPASLRPPENKEDPTP